MRSPQSCQLIELYALLGKKWTVIIIHSIGNIPITFNELEKLFKRKISPILLSQRLKQLQEFKLIRKEVINGRACYVITHEGEDVKEIMHKLKKISIKMGYFLPHACRNNLCACSELHNLKELLHA